MPESRPAFLSDPADWRSRSQQAAYREVLSAFSYPGRVSELQTPSAQALPLLLATLVDASATMADPCALIDAGDRHRLGALIVPPERARWIVVPGVQAPDFQPDLGSLESPEHGATIVLSVDALGGGSGLQLSGPGIPEVGNLAIGGVHPAWWTSRARWNAGFPMGVDFVLVCGRRLAALPRTIRTRMNGAH